jgi:hypothetical protein
MFELIQDPHSDQHKVEDLINYCTQYLNIGFGMLSGLLNVTSNSLLRGLVEVVQDSQLDPAAHPNKQILHSERKAFLKLKALYNVLILIQKYNILIPPLNLLNESIDYNYKEDETGEISFEQISLLGLVVDRTQICFSPKLSLLVYSLTTAAHEPSGLEQRVERVHKILEQKTEAPVYVTRKFPTINDEFHLNIKSGLFRINDFGVQVYSDVTKEALFDIDLSDLETFLINID